MYSQEVRLVNPQAAKAKAERYQRWAEEDGLKDAIQSIRQAYINSFIGSAVTDTQGRENVYIALKIIDKIEGHIQNVIGGGKIAEKELAKIEKEQTRGRFKII